MTIENVTKRASKAMYELSLASEILQPLLYELNGEDNLKTLLDGLHRINSAQQELVKILAQDNKVESL